VKKSLLLSVALLLVIGALPALAANSIAVNGPGLNSTNFKLAITDEDDCGAADTPVFVQSDEPNNESHIKMKFYLNAETLTAPPAGGGRAFRFLNLQDADDPANPVAILFLQRQSTTGKWRLVGWIRDTETPGWIYAGSLFAFDYQSAASQPQFECDWYAAGAANTARFTCMKVGTPQVFDTGTTLPTNDRGVDSVQIGFFDYDGYGGVTGPNMCTGGGALNFDEYESYR